MRLHSDYTHIVASCVKGCRMANILAFGENVDGYDIPVINEREARAAAGILFLFGMISFMNAFLLHEFGYTKIFVTFFMIDFFVRIFINPRFSPSLIVGRFFVKNQTPEYVGAPQKRWAWSIGFILALVMFFVLVVFELMTPIKIGICLLCLLFLFSESSFGICIGCTLYRLTHKDNAQYCPGEVCSIRKSHKIQKISFVQVGIILCTLLVVTGLGISAYHDSHESRLGKPMMKCGVGKCGGS